MAINLPTDRPTATATSAACSRDPPSLESDVANSVRSPFVGFHFMFFPFPFIISEMLLMLALFLLSAGREILLLIDTKSSVALIHSDVNLAASRGFKFEIQATVPFWSAETDLRASVCVRVRPSVRPWVSLGMQFRLGPGSLRITLARR